MRLKAVVLEMQRLASDNAFSHKELRLTYLTIFQYIVSTSSTGTKMCLCGPGYEAQTVAVTQIQTLSLCTNLAEWAEVEAEGLGVPRSGVHEVPRKQNELQEPAEGFALPHLVAGCIHRHDVWTQVIDLLLKLQFKQDGVEPGPQTFHTTHLEDNKGENK